MDILELVDFTSAEFARICRVFVAIHWVAEHHARRCHHGLSLASILVSNQVSVCLEVELALMVIHNGSHGALSHPFDALLPRPLDLLLDILSIIVLNLLNSIYIKNRVKGYRDL